jgi:hypothetical protein
MSLLQCGRSCLHAIAMYVYPVLSRPDLSGVGGTAGCVPITGWSLLCLSPPSILGLLPFRRPELGVYWLAL